MADTRPWAVGSLCKAFYQFGDGFIYRVTDISHYQDTTTLTLEPVFCAFASEVAGKKHSKTRTLGSMLCTPLSLNDCEAEKLRLERFIAEELARGTQNNLRADQNPNANARHAIAKSKAAAKPKVKQDKLKKK
eukprot:TRINITY_DN11312_c0_g1_i1.p1 TRINITY_DN11312_c0_g1~~TRINITY_DN11312_c0_g1_i1.p1  ORF type:complete len:155 (+),score=26.18 TRINITY_DN11312_c0_g1_i1:68-466(+)